MHNIVLDIPGFVHHMEFIRLNAELLVIRGNLISVFLVRDVKVKGVINARNPLKILLHPFENRKIRLEFIGEKANFELGKDAGNPSSGCRSRFGLKILKERQIIPEMDMGIQ
jgi:hypothetical protein